jgi:sterol desaturase/sphingolipid hydroxylase (fatty acid hydroxylase superfamily)
MDAAWARVTSWGPPWAWFITMLFVAHAVSLWGGSAIFEAMHRRNVLERFRVAKGKPPSDVQVKRMYVHAALNTALFSFGAALVYAALRVRGVDFSAPPPSGWTIAWQLCAFVFVTDTSFYAMHRSLHRPRFFAKVHRRHHEFRYVRAPSAEFGHPAEDFGNFVCTFLGPILFGAHPLTVIVWLFFRVLETVDAHSGYALTPWARRHAYHHEFNRGNFGAFLSIWDRLLGTEKKHA